MSDDNRNCILRSGHGTSRGSSRGRARGRSWRGVVKVAVETRLDNFGTFQAPYIPQEDGRVTVGLLPWAVVNRVKRICES